LPEEDATQKTQEGWLQRLIDWVLADPPLYIRYFFPILVTLGIIGGIAAVWIPVETGWLRQDGLKDEAEQKSISDLRLHFLYITGGVIAILTLLQTNWKNQVDHRKVEDDIQKNKNDHIRQVHAERRSRYTKAVEQLGDEKATVRLGGIYTLVGLVDEWLSDDALGSKEQQKEGQVIINNLCSYIRSPFPQAEKIEEYEAHKKLEEFKSKDHGLLSDEESWKYQILLERFKDADKYNKPTELTQDYADYRAEQDVRRTIFTEMSKRSSTFDNDNTDCTFGIWSKFDFDFSQAPIFYSLDDLTIEKAFFPSAKFYGDASFARVTFAQDAFFHNALFTQDIYFFKAIFAQDADFCMATFAQKARFFEATFSMRVSFHGTAFSHGANFIKATFAQDAYFTNSTFSQDTYFGYATFIQNAIFNNATFAQKAYFDDTIFTQNAIFKHTIFKYAIFASVTFPKNAIFNKTIFNECADFYETTFTQNAHFLGTVFNQEADFFEVNFKTYKPAFTRGSCRALFSAQADPQDYIFSVCKGSQPIDPGTASLLGKPFEIPVGAVLFDPDSWDEEKQEYTRVSAPAEPLDESDEAEEDESE
jgi:uncharacterized low-complexity protein